MCESASSAGQWADVGAGLLNLPVGDEIKVAARAPEAGAPGLTGLERFSITVGESGSTCIADLYSMQPIVEESAPRSKSSAPRPTMAVATADGMTTRHY